MKLRSEFGEALEMTSAKRGSTVFGETSERVRRSFGVPFSASIKYNTSTGVNLHFAKLELRIYGP